MKTNSQLGIKSIGYTVGQELSQEPKNMLEKLNNQEKLSNYKKLVFTRGNKKDYDFTNFGSLRQLLRAIYYGGILIPGAEREQDDFDNRFKKLERHRPKKDSKYNKLKYDLLINAKKKKIYIYIYKGRKMIIEAFKNKILPLKNPADYSNNVSEEGAPTSSLDFSTSSPDLSTSISPRSSSNSPKSSDSEDEQ